MSALDDMTLDEATGWLARESHACACVGGPTCCIRVYDRAGALQRAAHIAVRQVADLAQRKTNEGETRMSTTTRETWRLFQDDWPIQMWIGPANTRLPNDSQTPLPDAMTPAAEVNPVSSTYRRSIDNADADISITVDARLREIPIGEPLTVAWVCVPDDHTKPPIRVHGTVEFDAWDGGLLLGRALADDDGFFLYRYYQ